MKTISTKYLSATNFKGSRIKATDCDNSITISYPHELNHEQAHMKAAQALMEKMDWLGEMMGGHTKDGMVFIFPDNDYVIKPRPCNEREED